MGSSPIKVYTMAKTFPVENLKHLKPSNNILTSKEFETFIYLFIYLSFCPPSMLVCLVLDEEFLIN